MEVIVEVIDHFNNIKTIIYVESYYSTFHQQVCNQFCQLKFYQPNDEEDAVNGSNEEDKTVQILI